MLSRANDLAIVVSPFDSPHQGLQEDRRNPWTSLGGRDPEAAAAGVAGIFQEQALETAGGDTASELC